MSSQKEKNVHLLYGPPGSGKSTMAKEFCSRLDIAYISVGDVTRGEIAKGTINGRALQRCLAKVIEYPADLISCVVEERIKSVIEAGSDFILDGFPKYEGEAKSFIEMKRRLNLKVDNLIIIELPYEIALKRVSGRRICKSCLIQVEISGKEEKCSYCGGRLEIRDDDRPKILSRRYGDYEVSIDTVLKTLHGHYRKLVKIDGRKSSEEILQETIAKVGFVLPG